MSDNQHFLEASTSRFKKQLSDSSRTTTSNPLFEQVVNHMRREAEIRQIEGRLRVLEKEEETFREALFESVEERKKLITEIHQHFNTIEQRLLQREIDRGESYGRAIQIISLMKDRRAGLLQVLCQDSNPSIVNKGLRTKALR